MSEKKKPMIFVDDSVYADEQVYRHLKSILNSFDCCDYPMVRKPKAGKELTKYDHQAILENEIKQANKAAKRLARRQN